ncbi:MAG: sulfotransferase [Betaproteobacteria bacterium]
MNELGDARPMRPGTGTGFAHRDAPAAQAARLLQHGLQAAGDSRAEDAIAAFRQAVALRPDFVAALADLGLLLVATGRHAQAEPHLHSALATLAVDANLRNALGVAQEAMKRYPEAERTYRAALATQAEHPEAHANLGNCLRRLGRHDEARAHCLRAIELKPDFAVAHFNLGVLLQDLNQHGDAIAHYRRALACHPGHIGTLNNLGACLKTQGRLADARDAFERVLALQPHHVEAHCNLSQLKTYASDDPQIDALLSQRQRLPSLPEHGRIRYWFAVGKMLEDAGRFDESFDAYAQGNRLKHAVTPWDAGAHLDLRRRIATTFTRAVVARGDADEEADGPIPVFIVGMPRSGTSLLEQVLATLPGVHGAGELTWLTEVLHEAAGGLPDGDTRLLESLVESSTAVLRGLGRRYVERLRTLAPQATHVVDKLPANFLHVGLIHLMLPHARIVRAMRDPMDACFSCWSRLFGADNLPYTYDLDALAQYWLGYDETMRHWREVLPEGRMLDMPYETLVADFENQARRLVAYLGLPWDERCLGFHANPRVVRTASHAQVRRPIYRTSVARWKPFERHLTRLLQAVGHRR